MDKMAQFKLEVGIYISGYAVVCLIVVSIILVSSSGFRRNSI